MNKQPSSRPHPRPMHSTSKPAPAISDKRSSSWPQKFRQQHSHIKVAAALVLAGLIGIFVLNYRQARNELMLNDGRKLAAHIDKFLELPKNEAPTLATVKDASKLRSQAFFQHAQDGDKALIYPQAGKAVLYRPDAKKVIEYMSIKLDTSPKK